MYNRIAHILNCKKTTTPLMRREACATVCGIIRAITDTIRLWIDDVGHLCLTRPLLSAHQHPYVHFYKQGASNFLFRPCRLAWSGLVQPKTPSLISFQPRKAPSQKGDPARWAAVCGIGAAWRRLAPPSSPPFPRLDAPNRRRLLNCRQTVISGNWN